MGGNFAPKYARVGEILLQTRIPPSRPNRVVIAEDAFAAADDAVANVLRPLADRVAARAADSETLRLSDRGLAEWARQQAVLAGRQSLASAAEWIDRVNPRFGFEVAQRYTYSMANTDADVAQARGERDEIWARMDEVLGEGVVVCLPTSPVVAPPVGQTMAQRQACRQRMVSLTCIAGTCGAPELSLPLAEVDGLPVGLSLIAARGADELLIAFAREIVEGCR